LTTFDAVYEVLIIIFICEILQDQGAEFLFLALRDRVFSARYALQLSVLSGRVRVDDKIANFDVLKNRGRIQALTSYSDSSNKLELPAVLVNYGLE
jgi:hypothetical protein